jgi:hypothetical protein
LRTTLCLGLLAWLLTDVAEAATVAPFREGGAPADDDIALAAHSDDVVDYTLRATLDPVGHTVHGEGTIVWRNRSDAPVGELWVHLYLNAFKNDESAFLRERVGGRGSAALEDWGWIDVRKLILRERDGEAVDLWPKAELHPSDSASGTDDRADETDVRVPLPHPIAPGSEATLDVSFDDKLPSIVLRTGYRGRFHMVGQWFPKLARLEQGGRWAHFALHHLSEFYADFGSYDVTLDVPESFTLGATGPVVESKVVAGRRVERHVQRDVHDFAWTAWDEYSALRETIDGVDVTLLHPPGYSRVALRELAALRFALPYFSARYGRYPYAVLTVAHPPRDAAEAGGMEYPTLITTEAPWWTPACVRAPEVVTIHELAHQWFYGIVATNEAAWPVLDEGLTQFAEIDAMAKWRGEGSLVDLAGLELSDAAIQAVGGNTAVHDEPIAQAASAFSSGANYQRLVYARTSSILATLARVWGDDAVGAALGLYAHRYRFRHPDPEAFIAAFRDALGEQVGETLRAALFEKGWVDYAVDGLWTERAARIAGIFDDGGRRQKVEPGASDDGGWTGSVLVRRRGTLSFPVDVELSFADGSKRRERWSADGSWMQLTPHSPSALTHAVVDPDDRILVDMNLENNRAAAGGERTLAMRSLERVTYWMQLALQAVSP